MRAAQAGQADVAVMLGLAYACRSLQDWAGMGASVDRVLALDPRNLRALVMKGDSLEQAGDTKAASAYYRAALRSAPPPDRLPPDLLQELRRVEAGERAVREALRRPHARVAQGAWLRRIAGQ